MSHITGTWPTQGLNTPACDARELSWQWSGVRIEYGLMAIDTLKQELYYRSLSEQDI